MSEKVEAIPSNELRVEAIRLNDETIDDLQGVFRVDLLNVSHGKAKDDVSGREVRGVVIKRVGTDETVAELNTLQGADSRIHSWIGNEGHFMSSVGAGEGYRDWLAELRELRTELGLVKKEDERV